MTDASSASSHRWCWTVLMLAAVVAALAITMAARVTPFGDTPDESGHYSYVHDLAHGEILPRLGEAKMTVGRWGYDPEVWGVEDRNNYITQHPPLYYAIAAIPYRVVDQVSGGDHYWLGLVPRLISALSLGLLVLVLYRILVTVGLDSARATIVAGGIAFIPTTLHLASGANNDIFLFLISALATLYFARFVQQKRLHDAYICAVWLAMAGATKMTAWVLIAVLGPMLVYEMSARGWRWWLHAFGLAAVSVSTAGLWMLRNVVLFGEPFYRSGLDGAFEGERHRAGFAELLTDWPVMEWLMAHFHGLIGFSGHCVTPALQDICSGVRMTQVFGLSRTVFAIVLAAAVGVFMVYLLAVALKRWRQYAEPSFDGTERDGSVRGWVVSRVARKGRSRWLIAVGALVGASVSLALFTASQWPAYRFGDLHTAVMLAPPIAAALASPLLVMGGSPRERIAFYGPIAFAVFGVILFWQIHKGFTILGYPAGVHGRYLYPVLPLLIAGLGIAVSGLRIPVWFLALAGIAMVTGLGDALIAHVIPFYLETRL